MGLQKERGTSKLPNIKGFKFKVRIKYHIEKNISTKNNKLETF